MFIKAKIDFQTFCMQYHFLKNRFFNISNFFIKQYYIDNQ